MSNFGRKIRITLAYCKQGLQSAVHYIHSVSKTTNILEVIARKYGFKKLKCNEISVRYNFEFGESNFRNKIRIILAYCKQGLKSAAQYIHSVSKYFIITTSSSKNTPHKLLAFSEIVHITKTNFSASQCLPTSCSVYCKVILLLSSILSR